MPISPWTNQNGNQRVVNIPLSPQDYDRVTMTAVTTTNFADLLPVGANSRAAQRIQFYLYWLIVTPNTFPAAAAGGTGFIQIEALDAGSAVLFGPINIKAFSWQQGPGTGLVPYPFMPSFPHRVSLANAALATAVNIRVKCNVTAVFGAAPSAIVEIATGVDTWNPGPAGSIGGQDVRTQGANDPNQF